MFAFVSAFPKSLHCTDEAQQAETVLSAVLSIYIEKKLLERHIYIYHRKKEGSENKFNGKSPKGKCTCRDSNLPHRFA